MKSILEDAENTFRAFRENTENSAIRQIMRDIERSHVAMRAAIARARRNQMRGCDADPQKDRGGSWSAPGKC
jgi:hypothetical protein